MPSCPFPLSPRSVMTRCAGSSLPPQPYVASASPCIKLPVAVVGAKWELRGDAALWIRRAGRGRDTTAHYTGRTGYRRGRPGASHRCYHCSTIYLPLREGGAVATHTCRERLCLLLVSFIPVLIKLISSVCRHCPLQARFHLP
jgi:hypothetical protein